MILHFPVFKTSIFHGLPEELRITAMMTAVEMAPMVRKANTAHIERLERRNFERNKLKIEEGLKGCTDLMIDRLIYRRMWDSDRAWKTKTAVKNGLKKLKLKKTSMQH